MKKGILAIVITCCALALAFGLVACGGSSSGSAASSASGSAASASGSAAASSSDDAQAKAEDEAAAALEEGLGYWYGTGANGYDKEKARAAFQKAADGGNAEGWYCLAKVMETDTNANRKAQVADYYQKAADGGCAKGYCGLGYLYRKGWGVEQDAAKAKELYQKAIDEGELQGNISLGGLYEKGEGVEASGTAAKELYEKAAASDDWATRNAARTSLGQLYTRGAEGLEADQAKALDYFQQAADENFSGGWAGLGQMYTDTVYDRGEGAGVDGEKAFEYYTKVAEMGQYTNLASLYWAGTGCEQDYAKAIELYKKEIDGGKKASWAMKWLGYMAMYGQGMDQDNAVAADWFHKALDAAAPSDEGNVENVNEYLDQIASNS